MGRASGVTAMGVSFAGINVDATVNLGTILAIATFLVTILKLHRANQREIKSVATEASAAMARLETKIDALWHWWTGQHSPGK